LQPAEPVSLTNDHEVIMTMHPDLMLGTARGTTTAPGPALYSRVRAAAFQADRHLGT